MKTMYKHVKFGLDLIWSNPIKVWFIMATLYLGYNALTMERYIKSEVVEVKKLPDNNYYVHLKGNDKKWELVEDKNDIRGKYLYKSTSGVLVLFILLLAIGNLWFWGFIADSNKRGWDFYQLYIKHYPENLEVYNVYNTDSSIRLYTVNGYMCLYEYVHGDDDQRNKESAVRYYFSRGLKIKYFDPKQNRIDTINNIIND